MLHQALFLALYLGLLPALLVSPFAGVLLYQWLDYLPPLEVYSLSVIPGYLALVIGALTFFLWIIKERKTLPRPFSIILCMLGLLIWINITTYYALVPDAAAFKWDRTVKVIGFAILTAQMLSTRARLEAAIWTFVLAVTYFGLPSAIKVVVSGGSGGIGTGEVVEAAGGSFFGDRVVLSVVLAMCLPFALYLKEYATLIPQPQRKWMRLAMLAASVSFMLSLIGTFARTAVFAGGATLLMLGIKSRRKIAAILLVAATIVALLQVAPENWFERMRLIADYQSDESALSRIATWKWAWAMGVEHPIVGGGFGVFVTNAGHITGRAGWNEAHNIFFEMLGEHGFVGLALFCFLIILIYRSCAVVQKRVRASTETDDVWAGALARATQISLIAYVAGGSFVSIATSPFLYLLAGIAVGTRSLVEREQVASGAFVKGYSNPVVAPQPAE